MLIFDASDATSQRKAGRVAQAASRCEIERRSVRHAGRRCAMPASPLAATVATGTIDQTSSYAAILKQTPAAASTVSAESTAQGIISSISTWA